MKPTGKLLFEGGNLFCTIWEDFSLLFGSLSQNRQPRRPKDWKPMDPTSSSCMRGPQPSAPIWGSLRGTPDVTAASGLHHYTPAPFSCHPKADFTPYSDFSTPCLVAAPHSFPQEERAFGEQHPPFHPSEWHFAATEARRRLNPGLALGSGESEGSSPHLVSAAVGMNEEEAAPANTTNETEKKASKRKKESSGR